MRQQEVSTRREREMLVIENEVELTAQQTKKRRHSRTS